MRVKWEDGLKKTRMEAAHTNSLFCDYCGEVTAHRNLWVSCVSWYPHYKPTENC